MEGYKYDVFIRHKAKVLNGKIIGDDGDAMVIIANNSDPFYHCDFETRQEVNEFIKELEKARDEAFPISE